MKHEEEGFRPEHIYYDLLKKIDDDYNAGNITKEERDIMIQKATLDETNNRRIHQSVMNDMFGISYDSNENSPFFYQDKIFSFIDDKYISCEYNMQERKIAFNNFIFKLDLKKEYYNENNYNVICKAIYDDLVEKKVDLLDKNLSFDKYFI